MTDFQGCFCSKWKLSVPHALYHFDVPVPMEVEVPLAHLFPWFHQMRRGKHKDLSLSHYALDKPKRNHCFATTDEFLRAGDAPRSSDLLMSYSCILFAIIDWLSWNFAKANSMIWLTSRRDESFTELFAELIFIVSRTSTKSISFSASSLLRNF